MTETTSVRLVDLGAYPLAGAFVAFLIRNHGLDAFGRAYTSLGGLEQTSTAGLAPQTAWFEPGRYSVRFRGPASTPTSIGLRLTGVPDFPAPAPLE